MSLEQLKNRVAALLIVIALSSTIVAMTGTFGHADPQASDIPISIESDEETADRTMSYTIYDMFEEDWGEWWTNPDWGRIASYADAHLISSGDARNTMLYMPGYSIGSGLEKLYQGMIFAPYRWAVDGEYLPELAVTDPVFMPIRGPMSVTGTPSVSMDLYFQYLSTEWWNDYWIPTWSGTAGWQGDDLLYMGNDGYYIGTTYEIVLNRAAAESWFDIPQTADPVAWWAANKASYMSYWNTWINDQGNNVFDIWCGYEWPYVALATMMDMTTDGEGNVVMSIGHINWGYEVLMTRWLDDAGLCTHQPWFEDFSMHIDYDTLASNLAMDSVAQYGLHAVKADGTFDSSAWVWEPVRIDYVTHLGHPSEYEAYVDLKYTSWNAGDNLFSYPVTYDTTPGWFNLSDNEELVIEMPDETCIGYRGVATESEDYQNLIGNNDASGFEEIMIDGTMELGSWVSGGYDIGAGYDPVEKTITIAGPVDFDNERWPSGALYHGAPWIELNVNEEQPVEPVLVQMMPGSPKLSIVSVDIDVLSNGVLTMNLENHGLTRIAIEIYETTGNGDVLILKMNLNIRTSDAYPTGTIDVPLVDVAAGLTYEVRLTPGGQDDAYAGAIFTVEPSG